jgi:hypothetical protein
MCTVKVIKLGKFSTSTGSQAGIQQSCNLPIMTNGNFNVGMELGNQRLRGNSSCDEIVEKNQLGKYGSDSSSPWIAVFTTTMVNLTKYRCMVVDISVTGGSTGSNPNIRLYNNFTTNAVSLGGTKMVPCNWNLRWSKTLTVDLSQYSGNYHIGFDSSGVDLVVFRLPLLCHSASLNLE